jgi:hypothetical protein
VDIKMTKTYIEDLAAWTKDRENKATRNDKYVVAFMAVKCDVQAALEDGYAMKTIWEHLTAKGRLNCRYETFTHHVKRYIHTKSDAAVPSAETQASPATPALPPRDPPKITGFTFNPSPRKEDLL